MSRCLRAAGSLCVVIELIACSSPTTTAGAQAGAAGSDTGGATSSGGTNTTGGVQSVGGSEATGGRANTGGATGGSGNSGNSGNAGSGNGGGPAHVIGACNGLGAVNQFEDITPTSVDRSHGNGVVQILVDHVNAGTIYAGTDQQGLRKSTDCGSTWTKINTGKNSAVLDSGILWSMALDPVDPNVIYAGSLYGSNLGLFKSTNGGVDWDPLFPAGSEVAQTVDFFQDLSMDPTDHRHIVVSFHNNCKGAYAPMCLAETKDGGATWRLFKGPLGGWAEGSAPYVMGATTWLFRTVMDGIWYTSDSGATWENVGSGACPQGYRAADGTYYLASLYGVTKSADGHTWTKIAGSPNGYGIVGDGTRIFNSLRDSSSTKQPYFTASERDPSKWTALTSPNMSQGGVYLGYDADHHVLYSANTTSGLWRMLTK